MDTVERPPAGRLVDTAPQTWTVVVFEDDPTLQTLYRALFRPEVHLRCFSCVEDGLHALADADLVVTDVEMPGKGGLWLLRELLDRKVTTPILVVSGSLDFGERVSDAPNVRALAKPFSLKAVRNILASLSPWLPATAPQELLIV